MAITLVWNDVVALAPELSTVPSGQQTVILAQVVDEISEDKWGGSARAKIGGQYLAAHLASRIANGAGGSGHLQSVTVGSVSKTYGVGKGLALETTRYGTEYARLRAMWCPRMAVL